MMKGECPRLVLVFDAKGKNFRHDLYDDYKANRPECPMDLIPQFDLIREAAAAYGIHQLEAPNFEADDVIATLVTMALKEGVSANILSGDKDLMQLITPEYVPYLLQCKLVVGVSICSCMVFRICTEARFLLSKWWIP
jgi:DNA polymerase-1